MSIDLKKYQRNDVFNYLMRINIPGMRRHLCFGCKYSKLYDKNNKEYKINHHSATIGEVDTIIEEIKKANES